MGEDFVEIDVSVDSSNVFVVFGLRFVASNSPSTRGWACSLFTALALVFLGSSPLVSDLPIIAMSDSTPRHL